VNTSQYPQKAGVTLEEMLFARDARVERQQKMLKEFPYTLICFTLNIAGPYKQFPLALKTFSEGKEQILSQLHCNRCKIIKSEFVREKTGCEGYFGVDGDAASIKKLMVAIEDGSPLARLFDIDVLASDGKKISRTDLGCKSRRCLICGCPAQACARSRRHSVDELTQKTLELMQTYFNGKYADEIAKTATRALLYEVCVTPKPGLVDRWNNGAHRNMDIFTFLDSCVTLTPFFREFTLRGLTSGQEDPHLLYLELKDTGKQAEKAMMEATGGVNTHKGAIFSIGLLCAALGFLRKKGIPYCSDAVFDLCRRMTADDLSKDLSCITAQNAATHGEKVYAKLGIAGVRGEAASGYQSVRRYGLPMLKWLLSQGIPLNDACVITLLNLIANVQDTNILSRTGCRPPDIRSKIEHTVKAMGSSTESIARAVEQLNGEFVRANISPGGCADLLAFTLMLYFLEQS
jgi:holo-ACP synthase/triphosphoribosyl-dephospho-CoA synthase